MTSSRPPATPPEPDTHDDARDDAHRFWDEHYREAAGPGELPHPQLRAVAATLAPGTALELACGNGSDALWLAHNGWHVTAVDIASTAVERLQRRADADRARAGGLAGRLVAEQHDLAVSFPRGRFDLIYALYFHSGFDLDRPAVLRDAAAALNPGGRLLVVDHASIAPWSWNQDPDQVFPSADELAADLALDPDRWQIERAQRVRREAFGPGGARAQVADTVLVLLRGGVRS